MRYLLLICILTSCALTSKYKGFDGIYYKFLTDSEKQQISNEGEIFKEMKLYDPDGNLPPISGTLRISMLDNKYKFVRIGKWYDAYFDIQGIEHRDTANFDSLGNVLNRVVYQINNTQEFVLIQEWSSEISDNKFIQNIKIFNQGVIQWEGTSLVVDYNTIKPFIDKKSIKYGKSITYNSQGEIEKIEIYDEQGNKISEEKYRR